MLHGPLGLTLRTVSGERENSAGRESLTGGIFLRRSTWERNERNRAVL